MISSVKLTVLFEDPFWIGIFEGEEDMSLRVSKVVFGAEPNEAQIFQFIIRNYYSLNFSNPVIMENKILNNKRENPKRVQRKIKRETTTKGIGTKAQVAIKKQYEENKKEHEKTKKIKAEKDKQRKFEIKKKKKLEKHKGH